MSKIAGYLAIGAGIGLVTAYWQDIGSEHVIVGPEPTDRAMLDQKLGELETLVELERMERQALADEIARFSVSIAALSAQDIGEGQSPNLPSERFATASSKNRDNPLIDNISSMLADGTSGSRESFDQFVRQQQFDRFVAAGIAPDRAQLIIQLEERVELDVLRERFAATQAGATVQEVAKITPMARLRRELGDVDYAKYLDTRGWPNSVGVRGVLSGSPAEIAGVRPGDEIVSYNGQRAFDLEELTVLSFEAAVDTTVPLEVIRDGQTIQIYVKAGPIGIREGVRY